ncbi:protein tramtrack, alpha isoform-like isoform X2 [Palaemon carinicauda]|uniref:protein tramtrack, alpha isoform-like isoform X2 n=1 Tax=Palaemon carinicauda TaxID=392227 RepID=UPI0035B5CBC4
MEELLSLKWNNHRSTFLHILGVLRDKQSYTDVTIACDGKFYSVHKLVLSTCSDYFCAMFEKTACKSPVIVLKDIKSGELEALLDYMYLGEVNVRQSDLASLIKAAENLRIKGLAVPDDEPPSKKGSVGAPSRRDGGCGSPPAKRKRRDESEDGREDVRPIPTMLPTPPPPSRPKSPVIQRLSPSPHRTQDSSSTEEHSNRPHSSPAEPSASSLSTSQAPQPSGNDQYSSDETLVKVEMEDEAPDTDGPEYNVNADGYKEEDDSSGAINNDLPEFLQAAASGTLSSSTSFSHPSFAGPSSYQPGDLAGWQGDVSSMGFPSHLNFSASDSSSQQNAPGEAVVLGDGCSWAQGNILVCSLCGKTAQGRNRRQNMDNHLLTHTGERPFQCTVCSYRSTQFGNLKRHVRAVHKEVLEDTLSNSGTTSEQCSDLGFGPPQTPFYRNLPISTPNITISSYSQSSAQKADISCANLSAFSATSQTSQFGRENDPPFGLQLHQKTDSGVPSESNS